MRDIISIIPVESKHADAIQELASHPKVAETTNIPQPYPKNGAMSWIMSSLPRRMAGLEHAFAIQRSTDDQVVGVTSLMNVCRSEGGVGLLGWSAVLGKGVCHAGQSFDSCLRI